MTNKSDYVLAVLVSFIIGLWILTCYHCFLLLEGWRFYVLVFGIMIGLILIAFFDDDHTHPLSSTGKS